MHNERVGYIKQGVALLLSFYNKHIEVMMAPHYVLIFRSKEHSRTRRYQCVFKLLSSG